MIFPTEYIRGRQIEMCEGYVMSYVTIADRRLNFNSLQDGTVVVRLLFMS